MFEVIDKRKPNCVRIDLIAPGGVFIVDIKSDLIILGQVMSLSGLADVSNNRDYTPYAILNGTRAGSINFRGNNCIVEQVSLITSITTYTP